MLEAEVKLAIDEGTRSRLVARLNELGATPLGSRRQVDTYFAHPARDFAASDEALRLRLEVEELCITYKGPKLAPRLKTREEIEFGLATDLDSATRLLERLGFRTVARVAKRRTDHRLDGPPAVTVSLDEVEGLGSFCEVEIAATSAAAGRSALEKALRTLALDGAPPISRSYLEMLLGAPG